MGLCAFFFAVKEISAKEVKNIINDKKEDFLLLDVRQPEEYNKIKIEGSKLIPLLSLNKNFRESDKNKKIIIYCRSGHRSNLAVRILHAKGYKNVFSMAKGIQDYFS
ncbi:MAG: sulfurtransferase [Deltaproteobacteria bacterium]|nr:MAG: sulfurtransferase [Deltaproteobacteria bacterium]